MENVINNLREKSILHQNQVINIKKYISQKYKSEEASRRAAIFADAVYNIVDESVKKFEKEHRLQIRSEVLKSAVAKDIFDISGYDVFEVCSLLPIDDNSENVKEQFYKTLTDWLNENQEEKVTIEETKLLTAQIIDDAVSKAVDLLEESVLIEPEIKDAINEDKINEVKTIEISENGNRLYNDNPDLEDHITDGRFMETKGDIVELSASDIEKAIKESKELYGDLDDIEVEEKIDKKLIRKEMDKINNRVDEESTNVKDVESTNLYEKVEIQEDQSPEEEVFDSMDVLFNEDDWTETTVTHKIQSQRLSGYELKPPEVGGGNEGLNYRIKLIIIIPAVLVALALIIFLIVSAINVSKRQGQIEDELKQSQETELSSERLVGETIPNANSITRLREDKAEVIEGVNYREGSHLDQALKYKDINSDLLKNYLIDKNSTLSEDYYIEVFIQVAKDYNVNPLLLVAITGQEQNFVPIDHPDADLMKNNPFNVYISWKSYNTNFEDACKIAARTILTSSENRPDDEEPIQWINNTYAEDKNWSVGVRYFFDELTLMTVNE